MFYTLYPYDVLAKHEIHPRVQARVIQDFIPTEREESEAWQVLRQMRSRLKTDFFLFQTCDEERLARFQDQLHKMTTAPQASLIRSQLNDDAPMILLLAGERQEAKNILEELHLKNPGDVRAVHRLALICYAEAQHHEENQQCEQAVAYWQLAISYWVRTLVDDNYWSDWCNERRRCYQERSQELLKVGFKTAVRNDLYKQLTEVLNELVDTHAREGKPEHAQAYARLLTLYEAERSGANALKAAGGIRLSNGQLLVCGPLLLKRLGLSQELNKLIDQLQDDLTRYEALPAARALAQRLEPKVSSPTIKQLRLYFSHLLLVTALLNLNKPEEALEQLAAATTTQNELSLTDELYAGLKDGAAFYARDVAELAIRAHISLAHQYLTSVPPNLQAAESAWRNIMKQATESNLRRYAAEAICDLAIGRVNALQTETTRELMEQLTEAIEILEKARSVLRGLNSVEVASVLAEKLILRGKQHGFQEHYEAAVDDMRRAFDLMPEDAYIRDQYCVHLVHYALDKVKNGLSDEALTMMEQAKRLVEKGLLEYPDDEDFKATFEWIQVEIYSLLHEGAEERAWADLDQVLQRVKQPSADYALRELVKEAEIKRSKDDFIGAANLIEQALQQNPDYAWAKAEAVEIYVQWGFELLEDGNFEEAEQKARLGAQYGINSLHLQELQVEIARVGKLLER